MDFHDLASIVRGEPQWESEDGDAAFWMLGEFNGGAIWVGTFTGRSPWTRHPDGDALYHLLAGTLEVETMTDEGPERTTVEAGTVFVMPRGVWHRQACEEPVTQWGTNPGRVEHSEHEDPRREG